MQTLIQFITSLNDSESDPGLSVQMRSLWYDGKGDWDLAHEQVDQLSDQESAWLHAYLHCKEGDLTNADYWYRKAGRRRPEVSLQEEWTELVDHFLHG